MANAMLDNGSSQCSTEAPVNNDKECDHEVSKITIGIDKIRCKTSDKKSEDLTESCNQVNLQSDDGRANGEKDKQCQPISCPDCRGIQGKFDLYKNVTESNICLFKEKLMNTSELIKRYSQALQDCEDLSRENQSLGEKLKKCYSENGVLRVQLEKAKQANEPLKKVATRLETQNIALTEQFKAEQDKNDKLLTAFFDEVTKSTTINTKSERTEKECSSLAVRLEKREKEIKKLKLQLKSAQAAKRKALSKGKSFEKQVERMGQQVCLYQDKLKVKKKSPKREQQKRKTIVFQKASDQFVQGCAKAAKKKGGLPKTGTFLLSGADKDGSYGDATTADDTQDDEVAEILSSCLPKLKEKSYTFVDTLIPEFVMPSPPLSPIPPSPAPPLRHGSGSAVATNGNAKVELRSRKALFRVGRSESAVLNSRGSCSLDCGANGSLSFQRKKNRPRQLIDREYASDMDVASSTETSPKKSPTLKRPSSEPTLSALVETMTGNVSSIAKKFFLKEETSQSHENDIDDFSSDDAFSCSNKGTMESSSLSNDEDVCASTVVDVDESEDVCRADEAAPSHALGKKQDTPMSKEGEESSSNIAYNEESFRIDVETRRGADDAHSSSAVHLTEGSNTMVLNSLNGESSPRTDVLYTENRSKQSDSLIPLEVDKQASNRGVYGSVEKLHAKQAEQGDGGYLLSPVSASLDKNVVRSSEPSKMDVEPSAVEAKAKRPLESGGTSSEDTTRSKGMWHIESDMQMKEGGQQKMEKHCILPCSLRVIKVEDGSGMLEDENESHKDASIVNRKNHNSNKRLLEAVNSCQDEPFISSKKSKFADKEEEETDEGVNIGKNGSSVVSARPDEHVDVISSEISLRYQNNFKGMSYNADDDKLTLSMDARIENKEKLDFGEVASQPAVSDNRDNNSALLERSAANKADQETMNTESETIDHPDQVTMNTESETIDHPDQVTMNTESETIDHLDQVTMNTESKTKDYPDQVTINTESETIDNLDQVSVNKESETIDHLDQVTMNTESKTKDYQDQVTINTESETIDHPDPVTMNTESETIDHPDQVTMNKESETLDHPDQVIMNTVSETIDHPDQVTMNTESETIDHPDPVTMNKESETIDHPDPVTINKESETIDHLDQVNTKSKSEIVHLDQVSMNTESKTIDHPDQVNTNSESEIGHLDQVNTKSKSEIGHPDQVTMSTESETIDHPDQVNTKSKSEIGHPDQVTMSTESETIDHPDQVNTNSESEIGHLGQVSMNTESITVDSSHCLHNDLQKETYAKLSASAMVHKSAASKSNCTLSSGAVIMRSLNPRTAGVSMNNNPVAVGQQGNEQQISIDMIIAEETTSLPQLSPLPPSPPTQTLPMLSPLPITPLPDVVSPLLSPPKLATSPSMNASRLANSIYQAVVVAKPRAMKSLVSKRTLDFTDSMANCRNCTALAPGAATAEKAAKAQRTINRTRSMEILSRVRNTSPFQKIKRPMDDVEDKAETCQARGHGNVALPRNEKTGEANGGLAGSITAIGTTSSMSLSSANVSLVNSAEKATMEAKTGNEQGLVALVEGSSDQLQQPRIPRRKRMTDGDSHETKNKSGCHFATKLDLLSKRVGQTELEYAQFCLARLHDSATPMEVVQKFSLLENVSSASSVATAIIEHLKLRGEDNLLAAYQRLDCVDQDDANGKWKQLGKCPLFTETEKLVLMVLADCVNIPHLSNIVVLLLQRLPKSILEEPGMRMEARLSLSRLFTALSCDRRSFEPYKNFLYDVTRSEALSEIQDTVLISCFCVWPKFFTSASNPAEIRNAREKQGFHSLVFSFQVITCFKASKDKSSSMYKALQKILPWCSTKDDPLGSLCEILLETLESDQLQNEVSSEESKEVFGPVAKDLTKAFLLLSRQKGWVWCNNMLVAEYLWAIFRRWSQQLANRADAGNKKVSDATIATAIRIIGEVSRLGLEDGFEDFASIVKMCTGILIRSKQLTSISTIVQVASAFTLLDIASTDRALITSQLTSWLAETRCNVPKELEHKVLSLQAEGNF